MVEREPRTLEPPYFIARVLVSDLPDLVALGWVDTGIRDTSPSIAEAIAILEWRQEQMPPPWWPTKRGE